MKRHRQVRACKRPGFECLGHKIQHNGSVRDCWNATRSAMWRSFWGNAASAGAAHLSQPLKLRLLQRATAPPLHYRASRWPPQKFIKSQLDITQRKMVGVLMKVAPYPEEAPEQFRRRRGRLAKQVCDVHGWWSKQWFTRAIAWDSHSRRPRNQYSWSAAVIQWKWRDAAWLQQRRSERGTSSLAGRTDTRSFRGRVQQRWETGIDYARNVIPDM